MPPGANLADVAYTLQTGRKALAQRRAVVCRAASDAVNALTSGEGVLTTFAPANRPVVFLFPGQGAQHVDMGRGLYADEPVFREWVDRCAALLEPQLGLDVRTVLYPEVDEAETATQRLDSSPRHGEWITVDAAGRPVRTWVVHPQRGDKAPVVVVIHEIFGLTDWVRGVADQLAADGFLAVAPDLLSGKGRDGGGTETFASRDDAVRAVSTLPRAATSN